MAESKDWKKTTIGELFTFIGGGTPSKTKRSYWNGDIPWASIKDISQVKVLSKTQDTITEEGLKSSAANLAEPGDLILGTRMLPGKPVITDIRTAINQDLKIVRPKIPIPAKFTYYQFEYLKQEFLNRAGGTTVQGITIEKINEIPFLLPPLPDQKRIVAKLDTLFGHLDRLRSRLDKIPVLLKQFRQAVLTQAVTGKLRGTVYRLEPLGNLGIEIQTGPFGSALHKEDYVVGGIPIINPSHIRDGKIIPDVSVSVKASKANELRTWQLKNNDVILGRRGEMGRAAKYDEQDGEMLCGTGSIILRAGALTAPQFLCYYLRSPYAVNYLQEHAVGSTMTNLNQNVILSLPFPVVSVAEQANLVAAIDNLLSLADSIEKSYLSVISSIVQLPTQLLAKAFSGE